MFERTITLSQLYVLFSRLEVKDRGYENIPFELDGMEIDMRKFFNVLQKEIYSHSKVYMN